MNNTTLSSIIEYSIVEASKKPIVYTYSVTITVIVITSILNVCVFCRRTLRSSACTYYFLATIPTILTNVIVSPVSITLINTHEIYINSTPTTCKLTQFLIYTTTLLYALMLVCASIDRYFSSSPIVRIRRFSQVRIARRVIIIVWILVFIYMAPFMAIFYYDPTSANINKCVQYSTTLTAVYLWTRVILYYFAIPIILGIFGALTIYNIRSQTRRVFPLNQTISNRRTEGQLARMLIIQVLVYFLFFTPAGIFYILLTFVPSMNTPYFITIRTLTILWQQGGFFISFFFYALSGKLYRKELKKMFRCN